MDPVFAILLVVAALVVGAVLGWFLGNRGVEAVREERDAREADFKQAIADLALATDRAGRVSSLMETADQLRLERDEARLAYAQVKEREAASRERLDEFRAAREEMTRQFRDAAAGLLGEAQQAFLKRADERFHQAGETNEMKIKALLAPVEQTLKRYESNVATIEKERTEAYGTLKGLMDAMRIGQESVKSEAARLVNALRAAPKARGRWGEQQLRNVLETCGLAEHTDFHMEVSVEAEGGRLRPDATIRVPGNSLLVIDAKVSLNAYQDAYAALDEGERAKHLSAHVASMKAHVTALGSKAYQSQFDNTPEFVIMFVPGEHFVSAAMEHAPELWDYAFDRRVLIATPTNLIAIARTVAAVWRQEKLAGEARQIADIGRELHARIATMGGHIAKLGKNLETANVAYNAFVGSIESQVMTQAKRFEAMNVDTGQKSIDPLPMVESTPRPLSKLSADAPALAEPQSEAAE
ncbi:DNA recombination protein RmuC [Sphingomonas baiyangensis]|uniref:DNA recombination protein RmuC homolog n=1 Tax=Sphingomonas baiyangensis TaxID=2572576 RepID=A0A4U1L1U0_9SPHN|nr:DNA recombination protein RmuC [Sphingomonas baiyangensis]TKD50799.1 DNA recombination protein RmuC [Sphingomonas baiyangensis]